MAPDVEVVTENRTLVVWCDPGLLTGLAWYDLDKEIYGCGQYDRRQMRQHLDEMADRAADRMVIGYERFNTTSGGPRTSTPEHSHKAIQVIEEFAQDHKVPLLRSQPSSARKLGSIVYLRRLGWYTPGKGHANDAAQHLLADLLKRKPIPAAVRGRLFPEYT